MRGKVVTMNYKGLIASFGVLVCMAGCGTEKPAEETAEQRLVPVTEAPELRNGGSSIFVIDGPEPLLVPGTVRDGAIEAVEQISEEPVLVSAMNATLNQWGSFRYDGGAFGKSYDVTVGGTCTGGQIRQSHNITDSGGGYCSFKRWYSSTPTDCRVVIHVGVGSFAEGHCQWEVYARPPTNVCPNSVCEYAEGETAFNCTDCDYCGNGVCGVSDDPFTCLEDCGYCGDNYCASREVDFCFQDCGGGTCDPRMEFCPIEM